MASMVPSVYFRDCSSWHIQYFSENRTWVIKLPNSRNIIENIFAVHDPHNGIGCYHLIGIRENCQYALQIAPTRFPYSLWEDCLLQINAAALVYLLNKKITLGSDSFWEKGKEGQTRESYNLSLQYENVPDTQQLNLLCAYLGKKSFIVKEYCDIICSWIRKKNREVVEVRAAYMPGKENEITFIVITKKGREKIKVLDRPIVQRSIDEVSKEACLVIENEKAITKKQRMELRSILDEHISYLLKKHTNITLLSISSIKSRNYGSRGQAKIDYKPCIVFYVRVKGLIPIDEHSFPRRINGYITDIREGAFTPYVLDSHLGHEQIKMGCLIQGLQDNTDADGNLLTGSLGGFIDHPDYGLCCFTSAHTILSGADIDAIKKGAYLQPQNDLACFQPCRPFKFGSIVLAACNDGGYDCPGVEVVLIKVENRQIDNHGRFPGAETIAYTSGDILEIDELLQYINRGDTYVLKYGAETGITVGRIRSDKVTPNNFIHGSLTFTLRNQIEITSDCTFAKPGDSGALVFHCSQDMTLKVIGILEGGTTHNTYIVTPICAILKSLRLSSPLHLKTFENASAELRRIKSDVEDMKAKLEQHDQKLDIIISLLKK